MSKTPDPPVTAANIMATPYTPNAMFQVNPQTDTESLLANACESLASASPAIVAQDFDWMQGKKLASYTIEGEGVPQDANLRVDVELTLDEGGAASKKRVAYVVGTDPTLTVFRSFD